MSTLYALTTEYKALMDLGDSSDPGDQQAFLDTLEGLDYEVGLKADAYASVMTMLSGKAAMVDAEIKRLTAIKKAIDGNVDRMKSALKNAMEAMDKTEIRTDLHTFKIVKNGGKLPLIVDGEVPELYIKYKPEVDNEHIRADLEAGANLDFAHFGERGTNLHIK